MSVLLFSMGYGQENNTSPTISKQEATFLYSEARKLTNWGKYTEAIATYEKIA